MSHEMLRRGYREILRDRWAVPEARIEAGSVDAVLPSDARLLCRSAHTADRKVEALPDLM